jgi:hypothetical protein
MSLDLTNFSSSLQNVLDGTTANTSVVDLVLLTKAYQGVTDGLLISDIEAAANTQIQSIINTGTLQIQSIQSLLGDLYLDTEEYLVGTTEWKVNTVNGSSNVVIQIKYQNSSSYDYETADGLGEAEFYEFTMPDGTVLRKGSQKTSDVSSTTYGIINTETSKLDQIANNLSNLEAIFNSLTQIDYLYNNLNNITNTIQFTAAEANGGATIRLLADTNNDGIYNPIDYTPPGAVTSVNGVTGDVTSVATLNGLTGAITITGASSVNAQTGEITIEGGVTSVNGETGDVTVQSIPIQRVEDDYSISYTFT